MSSGVAEDDIALARLDEIAPVGSAHPATSLIWADVLGQARRNARPVALYLAFAIAAGVIAAIRRDRGQHDPDRRRDGDQPRHAPDQRSLRWPRQSAGATRPARARDARRRAGHVVPGSHAVAVALDLTNLMPSDFVLNAVGTGRPHHRRRRDRRGGLRRGSRRHPRPRDARELGGGRGHLRDDDSGRRLPRRGRRRWRGEQGVGCAGGARGERGGPAGGRDAHAPRSTALGARVHELEDVAQVRELMPDGRRFACDEQPAVPPVEAALRADQDTDEARAELRDVREVDDDGALAARTTSRSLCSSSRAVSISTVPRMVNRCDRRPGLVGDRRIGATLVSWPLRDRSPSWPACVRAGGTPPERRFR